MPEERAVQHAGFAKGPGATVVKGVVPVPSLSYTQPAYPAPQRYLKSVVAHIACVAAAQRGEMLLR